MELVIRGKHTAVPDPLKAYARKRLAKLDRYLPAAREAVVEIYHEDTKSAADRFVVEVTVNCNGTLLRAEERSADPRAAVDRVADVLANQSRRLKGRRVKRHHTGASRAAAPVEPAGEEDEEAAWPGGRVVRVKRFAVKPMTEEEAIQQMELLGHDFFLFQHAAEGTYALLYRRRDGNYGLLVPAES
ncbi:MAG TPA: ribosome-associated translation inhibitor RaiA [Dehalococcoidia bacterium]